MGKIIFNRGSFKDFIRMVIKSLNSKQDKLTGDPDTVLIFDSNGDLSGVNKSEFKGEKGDPGEKGEQGDQGIQGTIGPQGEKGATGAQGVSITKVEQITTSTASGGNNVIRVTLSNGVTSDFTIKNGAQGAKGATGATGPQGPQGIQGPRGATGATGPQGPAGVNATTTSVATTSANGLMSSAMVSKLNGIAAGATADSEMSDATIESIFNEVFG